MKKKIFIILIFCIFLFPFCVYAEGYLTCDYEGSYTNERYGTKETKKVTITCTLYDIGGNSCYVSTSGFQQSISNWSSQIGGGFTAKDYFNQNKTCFPYMVFLDKNSGIDRYEIYAADTYDRALSIGVDLGGKSTNYFYGIIPLKSSKDNEDNAVQEMYNKIVTYTNSANKMNTDEDPWELNKCLTEDGSLDPNAADLYVCKNKLQQFYEDIKNWQKEVQDAINSGLIDANDSRIAEFNNAIQKARSNVSETIDESLGKDDGIKDASRPDMSLGISNSDDADCNSIFNNKFGEILQNILDLIKFSIPIIVIALSVIDYMKALLAQNQDEMKKANQRFVKRLIIGVAIFVLPVILEFLMNIANSQCPNLPIK